MSTMPNELKLALEYAEDFATAHCVETHALSILIYRDTLGNEFRRVISDKGPIGIPQEFDDHVALARHGVQQTVSEQDLLALDAVLAQAAADGDRVVMIIDPKQ